MTIPNTRSLDPGSFVWKKCVKTCTLLCFQVVNEMERDFDLLGITAVEDKIQIGVPETVGVFGDHQNWSQMLAVHVSRINDQ